MRPYWAVMKTRCLMQLQYRAAAIAGFCTQLFWGLLLTMLYSAFFQSSRSPKPMTLPQVISYIWLGQAMLLVLPWNTDRDLAGMIRNGAVGYELVRPIRLYWYWFARFLAVKMVPMTMRSIPIFIVAIPLLGLQLPASPVHGLLFFAAILLGVLLSVSVIVCTNISNFWTISGEGANQILMAVIFLFSGSYIPLPLLPDWLQPIVRFLPFRGMMDVPFRLYLGNFPFDQVPLFFLGQCAWIAAFIVAGHFLLKRALQRVVIQGG